jgi:hypothetical protein
LTSPGLRLLLCAAASLGGCVPVPTIGAGAATPRFDPFVFFAGHSEGTATLRVVLARAVPVHVVSDGHVEGAELVLDQTVTEGSKPPRHRQWRLHAVGPGRYAGTLSDAAGGVTAEAQGNRLHIAFAMKGGLPTQQWLTLAADGQSARNLLVVRKFGLAVAVLDETIRRDGPGGHGGDGALRPAGSGG